MDAEAAAEKLAASNPTIESKDSWPGRRTGFNWIGEWRDQLG